MRAAAKLHLLCSHDSGFLFMTRRIHACMQSQLLGTSLTYRERVSSSRENDRDREGGKRGAKTVEGEIKGLVARGA
jgi:hypothetical protein